MPPYAVNLISPCVLGIKAKCREPSGSYTDTIHRIAGVIPLSERQGASRRFVLELPAASGLPLTKVALSN